MAFDAGAIKARMQLDNRQFKAGLQSSVQETRKADRAIGNIFRGGFMVAGITLATRQMNEFVKNAGKLDTINDAFVRMAGGVTKANALLQESRAVTRGLADRDLRSAANQLELLGIGMDKLPRFVEIARSAAIGLGQDVGYMLQSLSTGTARQSRLWLDNLGILISVEDANEEYARSLGKAASALTDTEERAAFLNAVLTRGQDIIDKVGSESVSSAEKMQSWGVFMRNMTDDLQTRTVPLLVAFHDTMMKMRDAGWPTGPGSLLDGLKSLVKYLDELQRKGHAAFPGIFGPGRPVPPAEPSDIGYGDLSGGRTPTQQRGNIVAAQRARQAYFDYLQESIAIGQKGLSTPTQFGTGNTFSPLDWREVSDPGLTLGTEEWQRSFDLIGSGLSTLGDSFAGFFEMLLTDSKNAGRAFFSGLMSGFSGVASSLGDLYIQAGIGMLGLMKLSPLMSIAAGFALKAIGGVLRGIAFNNAPVSVGSGVRSIRNPLVNGGELRGSFTLIVQGDFIGDRMWVDRLREKMRLGERNFGAPSAQWGGA